LESPEIHKNAKKPVPGTAGGISILKDSVLMSLKRDHPQAAHNSLQEIEQKQVLTYSLMVCAELA
jgi:hypothetical protein